MITKAQALTANEFHHNNWTNSDGSCARYRRNGATQTWKTRPNHFRIPVKRGLYEYAAISDLNADMVHLPGDETCVRICAHRGVKSYS